MGFDNLKLEKGMYREAGKSFTQVLEGIDPSDQYKGTSLEGTDAFQRQLKRFDIKVKGAYSDPVEKFFRTMDSAVLFPEYIARAVRTGMEEGDILPKITATTTTIDSMDYRSVYSVPSEEDKKLSRVAEGRRMSVAQVNEIAQGHVYLALDAKRIKLVDELGGIQQALDKAAKLAKLDDYHYEEYPAQKDFFDQLAGIGNSGSYLDSQMRNVLGQFYEPFRMLSTIHQQDRIQARMPFVILYN